MVKIKPENIEKLRRVIESCGGIIPIGSYTSLGDHNDNGSLPKIKPFKSSYVVKRKFEPKIKTRIITGKPQYSKPEIKR